MVKLTYEDSLLQDINDLSANGKIRDSVALTTQDPGSRLAAQNAISKIEKLIPTTHQRISATRFCLGLMGRIDFDFYLGIQTPSLPESKTLSPSKDFINFSDNNSLNVQIELRENNHSTLREASSLIVFIVLNGFFSNLISLEDCVAKMISIVYDLPLDDRPAYIRKALNDKMPDGKLTLHLRDFHAIVQDDKPDKTGSPFNIAREIRHQLTHDDIDGVVVSSSPISLSGSPPVPKLHFHNSFFPANVVPANTEMIAFCQNAHQKTVDFVDECYRLICADLRQSGVLPI